MTSDNEIQNVFENLQMRFHKKAEYYAANEFSDVWYFLIPRNGKWTLKIGMGEWDDGTLFVDAREYQRNMFVINALTIMGIIFFLPLIFIFSLFWIGAIFAIALGWMVPRYATLKAKWKVIPRLRSAGVEADFGGVVYLVQPEFEQVVGINSVSLRSTP